MDFLLRDEKLGTRRALLNEAINIIRRGPIPKHIAFIMDGNRRYAKAHGIPTAKGHYLGAEATSNVIEGCFLCGVKGVTVYAFSLENFNRSKGEIDQLMKLFKFQIHEICKPGGLAERFQASIRVLGQVDLLDENLKELLLQTMADTRRRKGGFINCCVAYTSRDEMVTAVSRAVRSSQLKHSSADITDETLTRYMYTADDPAVDVLVRTSGVSRLSDFLLWQCHEDTDIQIVDAMWPQFGIYHLFLVIVRWQRKQVNIGQANIQKALSLRQEDSAYLGYHLGC
ncbi:putative undecaprenyl diphosphate synthase-domain-containing protein [Aspergillus minisclerotigenes]|uniref:Alkyl transferase n=1 Tax=Aspergillus minisclerotigenes TaxID=656917 RepID=A0A5N6JAT1_9EURO|nr:putative undecaprenyl diphosphate synthase-domain-containing protein [Aspergillus minisclerotigenes]